MIHLTRFFRYFIFFYFIYIPFLFANRDVEVDTVLNYGNLIYRQVPSAEILSLQKNHNVLGLTIADLKISHKVDLYKNIEGDFLLKKVTFYIGFDNLSILIDNRYKTNSCEYNAILNHEKGHVKIYQAELKYYGALLLKKLKNLFLDEFSYSLKTYKTKEKLLNDINDLIYKNSDILLLKTKLEQVLITKNKQYDSKEEYLRVKKLCNNW